MDSNGTIKIWRASNIERAFVTHDPIIASSCDRIIFLKDGKVKEDLKRTGDKEQFYNEIITNWC